MTPGDTLPGLFSLNVVTDIFSDYFYLLVVAGTRGFHLAVAASLAINRSKAGNFSSPEGGLALS